MAAVLSTTWAWRENYQSTVAVHDVRIGVVYWSRVIRLNEILIKYFNLAF